MAWYVNLTWLIAQAAPAQAPAEAPTEIGQSIILNILLALAVTVGSFVLGAFVARRLRMRDYSFKIGLVLFTLLASLAVNFMGWPPKRGIDLSGGVVLIYEVDRGLTQPGWMQTAVDRINEQLNVEGGEKLEAQPISSDQVEIALPDGVEMGRVDRAVAELRTKADLTLQTAGKREEKGKTVLVYRIDQRQQKTVDMNKLIAAVGRRINPGGVKELTIRQYGAEQIEIIIPEIDEREVDQIKRKISTSGLLEFRIVANQNDDKDLIKTALKSPAREVYIGGKLEGRWVQAGPDLNTAGATVRETKAHGREVLVRIDPYDVDGRYLDRAFSTNQDGKPAVGFTFDAIGAEKFGELTRHNLPDPTIKLFRQLGIVLDNVLLSAPTINDTIRGNGIITGQNLDVDFLVGVLNAGSLPASLRPEPISQQRISSQLGDDTIQKGTWSIGISTAAILIFMAVYYRFCGLVADLAVVLNMLVTVALMILIKAAFTLPGLAGLVLTVGMAVDANVLIYERMREETERGASLRMAIRNGFGRAMNTIIDSHVTTLVSGMVLFIVGTDQIKGFAVTLIIGLLMSLFTAVFVARVIFDIAEKQRWLTKLKLMHVIGHTNIDFIRWRGPAIAVSVAIMLIGFVASYVRGKGLLDIDFTGGSSVQVVFAEPHDIADVRRTVEERLQDVAVSSVGDNDVEFKIDTSERDIKAVQAFLQEKFGKSLKTYSMSYGPLTTIEKPAVSVDSVSGPELTKPDEPARKEKASDEPGSKESKPAEPASEKPAAEEKSSQEKASEESKSEEPPTKESAPEASAPSKEQAPGEGEGKGEVKPEVKQPQQSPAKTDDPQVEELPSPTVPGAAPENSKSSAAPLVRRHLLQLASAVNDHALSALVLGQADAEQKPAADGEKPAATDVDEAAAEKPVATDADKPADAAPAAESTETKPAEASESNPADTAAAEDDTARDAGMVGGTRVALKFPQDISYTPLRAMIQKELDELNFKGAEFELHNPNFQFGSDARYKDWTLETTLKQDQALELLKKVEQQLGSTPVFPSSNQIGGKVAGDTQLMALYAMLASMAIIVIYIWIRFQNVVFGLAAVLALVHDVFVTTGFLAMSYYLAPYLGFLMVDPFKISLAVLAALLTIVGFSINDTIVVFDRIREVRGKSPDLTEEMINLSVNATLSRTLLTSGTVLIASVILYFVGGPGIHAFAYSMVVGVIAGTYSSVYIAAPVLLWLKKPTAKTPKSGAIASTAAAGNK